MSHNSLENCAHTDIVSNQPCALCCVQFSLMNITIEVISFISQVKIAENIALGYLDNLNTFGTLSGKGQYLSALFWQYYSSILCPHIQHILKFFNDPNFVSGGDLEPPTAILWVYHFLAQHFDYLRDSKKAMEYIDKALEHTPTLIEAYMVKARIYKVMETVHV